MEKLRLLLNGQEISNYRTPYIVAELSANHGGDLAEALATIEMAKRCGADAVKFQTYTADTLTINVNKPGFYINKGPWKGESLYELYERAHTPWQWHKEMFDKAREVGLTAFSTPFDETAVDFLEDLNVPAYKIASFEVIDLPLIKYVAQTKKPMIISTGMADLEEISEALETVRENGCKDIVLLHCVSGYPTPIEQINLNTITDLARKFNVLVGLSDHTLGVTAAITSVALGACMIEKHFTLSRKNNSPDAEFSIEPAELSHLCKEAKASWLALGKANYGRKPVESDSLIFRRSIYATQSIKTGEMFTIKNIRRIRPGFGLAPKYFETILGKKATKDIECGTPLSWDLINE